LTKFSRFSGIFFVLPCIESYQKVDLRTITLGVPPQEVSRVLKSIGSIYVHLCTLRICFCVAPCCATPFDTVGIDTNFGCMVQFQCSYKQAFYTCIRVLSLKLFRIWPKLACLCKM
jgi:hypothetical protein